MMKYKYRITVICIIALLSIGMEAFAAVDYTKSIEITESGISKGRKAAYFNVMLKNLGERKISELAFEIKYYDKDDELIQKAVVKHKLKEALAPDETRKYRIRLKGDIVNLSGEQYPYEHSERVDSFEVRVVSVKFGGK